MSAAPFALTAREMATAFGGVLTHGPDDRLECRAPDDVLGQPGRRGACNGATRRQPLLALLDRTPAGRVAVTVHHHIPTFHTEHCVYSHLLSKGRDFRSCGRPCEAHQVGLVHGRLTPAAIVVAPALAAIVRRGLTKDRDARPASIFELGRELAVPEGENLTIYVSAQIVAEELHVNVEKIEMILGDTDLTPYDRGTFGSRSFPYMGPHLRKAAATAREALIDMAADYWKSNRAALMIEDGKVVNSKTKKTIEIGKLTKGKQILKGVDEKVTVTPPEKWKVPPQGCQLAMALKLESFNLPSYSLSSDSTS